METANNYILKIYRIRYSVIWIISITDYMDSNKVHAIIGC